MLILEGANLEGANLAYAYYERAQSSATPPCQTAQ